MKILLITDIHIGTSRGSRSHAGMVRQANSQALEKLNSLVDTWNEQSYDAAFQLGDFISEERDARLSYKNDESFDGFAACMSRLNMKTVHLQGNHDVAAFPENRLKYLFLSRGLPVEFRGIAELGGYQFVWLDVECDQNGFGSLSSSTLRWLEQEVDAKKPTVILSHFPIVTFDMGGSFYFATAPPDANQYVNGKTISDILRTKNVKLAISAHIHLISVKRQESACFVSLPAFSEHLLESEHPDQNPGTYSVLELTEQGLCVKSYSGGYCFFNLEI